MKNLRLNIALVFILLRNSSGHTEAPVLKEDGSNESTSYVGASGKSASGESTSSEYIMSIEKKQHVKMVRCGNETEFKEADIDGDSDCEVIEEIKLLERTITTTRAAIEQKQIHGKKKVANSKPPVIRTAAYKKKTTTNPSVTPIIPKKLQVKRCTQKDSSSADAEFDVCVSSEETTMMTRFAFPTIRTTTKPPILPKGPFFNFVVNICETLLTRFSKYRISVYFKILSKSLKGLAYEYTIKRYMNKFCKRLKKLSEYNGDVLKGKVISFLKIIATGNPVINRFFYAMNAAYTSRDDFKMDDYIYLLVRYGEGSSRHIGQKTREIFQGLIFHVLYHLEESVMNDIQMKFALAVVDYMKKNEYNIF